MPRSHAKVRWDACTTKNELFNGESYIKKLYTRLYLQIPFHVLA